MDEVLGSENFVAQIAFNKTGGQSSTVLPGVADYLLWYAKAHGQLKYRQLFFAKAPGAEGATQYNWVETPDGVRRPMTSSESIETIPSSYRVFQPYPLVSMGQSSKPEPFQWRGRTVYPSPNRHWSVTTDGLAQIGKADRLLAIGDTLREHQPGRARARSDAPDGGEVPVLPHGGHARGPALRRLSARQPKGGLVSCLGLSWGLIQIGQDGYFGARADDIACWLPQPILLDTNVLTYLTDSRNPRPEWDAVVQGRTLILSFVTVGSWRRLRK
jgi:hypothetical protein